MSWDPSVKHQVGLDTLASGVRLRLMCDTVASLDARHSRAGSLTAYQRRDIVLSQRPQVLTDLIVNPLALGSTFVPIPEKQDKPFPACWNPRVWRVTGDVDYLLRGGVAAQQQVCLFLRPHDPEPVAQPWDLLRGIPAVPHRPAQRRQRPSQEPSPALTSLLARQPGQLVNARSPRISAAA
jgi:hypothetical protein